MKLSAGSWNFVTSSAHEARAQHALWGANCIVVTDLHIAQPIRCTGDQRTFCTLVALPCPACDLWEHSSYVEA